MRLCTAFLLSHFLVTLCCTWLWFGFDVPVILRSSDETESRLLTPEKQMVQMTNPFTLKLGSGPASVTDGVSVGPCCLEPCVLSCFWGCKVSALQGALQAHQHGLKLSTPQNYLEALHLQYHYCQTFHIGNLDRVERRAQIPADHEIKDFGLLPRECYPLVAVLTLAEPEARDAYNIVASVTVIHVPDDKYSLSARILFQYLLTSQGNMYELKPLFMSAVSRGASEPFHSEPNTQPREPDDEASRGEQTPVLEEDWSEGKGRDCVVCQNAAVNKVLLPCRHACVCDSCVSHFQHCPICRAFIHESFTLTQGPAAEQ
ncbi:cell growth regulator with RING finger domain protein 1 isoform X2 [Etheostoma cragini]|uniref:cell growth regulator with RING finger domain protein 1 isoform X2 n=1 Tax=Etheostoma cragini TaxID=417921 RepID=UPI00155F5187|nr:cell growth regulator with RING finger domain protein 1 isoform X2 [Etheostoma cragini]